MIQASAKAAEEGGGSDLCYGSRGRGWFRPLLRQQGKGVVQTSAMAAGEGGGSDLCYGSRGRGWFRPLLRQQGKGVVQASATAAGEGVVQTSAAAANFKAPGAGLVEHHVVQAIVQAVFLCLQIFALSSSMRHLRCH